MAAPIRCEAPVMSAALDCDIEELQSTGETLQDIDDEQGQERQPEPAPNFLSGQQERDEHR